MMPRPTLEESGLMPAHRKFIKHLLNGQNISNSSQLAGFGRQTGYGLMKNPAIKNELARQMEKAGITDQYLAKKIKQGLNAKTAPQKDGGTRYDDQFVRKQWADLAIKVKGGYAPEKIETEHKIIQLVIDGNMLQALKDSKAISRDELKELERMEDTEIIDAEISAIPGGEREVGPEDEGDGGAEQVSGEEVGSGDAEDGGREPAKEACSEAGREREAQESPQGGGEGLCGA
jgi:hypothetical protein